MWTMHISLINLYMPPCAHEFSSHLQGYQLPSFSFYCPWSLHPSSSVMAVTRVFFTMALAVGLAVSLALPTSDDHEEEQPTTTSFSYKLHGEHEPLMSARGVRHHRAKHNNPRPAKVTCREFPWICLATGSPGLDCCRRRCVNVMTDSLNCGSCGRRCQYGWACCGGECVNVMCDAKNCGSCNHQCKKGGFCSYGMCSYA